MTRVAVVTGASSGIGRELVRVFEEHGFDVLGFGEEDFDLATPAGVEGLYASVVRPVDVVALNAGIVVGGELAAGDLDAHLRLVDLNVRGVVHLSARFAADMVERGSGRMLFTSSLVATMPGPFQVTYNASKSFVQSFSLGLREELAGRGVSVTTLMPGPTDTRIFARAGQLDTVLGGLAPKADPAIVARAAYEGVMEGKARVVPPAPFGNRVFAAGTRVMPDSMKAKLNRFLAKPRSAR